ncbi:class I mannose-6-phosphate isomerase [Tessaracoccus lubricantis]|uniref:Class I mannose-6-phosphate isomerase n=1 Tax=Tessaracoccus lubricantis TaxID=545543 RepID=A0ABP9EXQ2_9ACTN
MTPQPQLLRSNQPPDRFYKGGAAIAELRSVPFEGGNTPEDWVASTTCLFGETNLGLTRLDSGELLRDAIAADPEAWLGREHVARWGTDTQLLTKLLHAGQRLPVHLHPDDAFAAQHLGRPHGKTEAWLVLQPGAVHLGFRRDVSPEELADLVERQDTEALLDALHTIEVNPGDGVLVPAGTPHAIGEGVFLVEVQQPEDMSILLEWKGFALDDDAPRELGLGWDLALQAADLTVHSPEQAESLVMRSPGVGQGLPDLSLSFFRADWVGAGELEAGFAVLVIIDGGGSLAWAEGELPLTTGSVVLLPHAAEAPRLTGDVRAVWCRPPAAGPRHA